MTQWRRFPKKNSVYVIWLSGLVLGILLAHSTKTLLTPNIRGDIFVPITSFVSLFITSIIPFVFSCVFVHFRKRNLLLSVLFVRACIFSYSFFWTSFTQWGNALAILYLQFLSSSCSSCFVVYLALQSGDAEPVRFQPQCSIMFMTLVIVCVVDYLLSCFLIS